ncbi:MAG TPA: metallophosphoesterase family protein [Gemmatimonadaceae bacterium]|nr:metallophosphoesterase family protein [Gemmatimonadaceae bacterium]
MQQTTVRRVAALYDIHGNLPALEAALDAADAAGVDLILVGGDLVPGPMPRETLDRLVELGPRARFIRGNCDRLVVDAMDGRTLPPLPAPALAAFTWTAARLDRHHRDFLAGFPSSLALTIAGLGEVLFCHATPRSDEEIFTAVTPAARVRPMVDGVAQRLVVCGHTHMAFDREVDGVRLVNAGSVGMPFGRPGAHWALLGPDVRPVCTAYDPEPAASRIRASGYPDAAGFAAQHVLAPVPEAEALRRFEQPPAASPPPR